MTGVQTCALPILLGTFETRPWVAALGVLGVIVAAVYMLPMVQRIWFGPLDKPENRVLPDLGRRELAVLLPLVAVMVGLGVYPKPLLERTEVTVVELLESAERRTLPSPPPLTELLRAGAPAELRAAR